MNQVTNDSTIPGFSFIFGDNRHKFTRISWMLALFASFSGFSFYVYEVYQKWKFSPDIVTITRARPLDKFPLPAVTICPPVYSRRDLLQINTTHSRYYTYYPNKYESNMSESECQYLAANMHWCSPMSSDMVVKECPDLKEESNVVELINQSALTLEETFIDCEITFSGKIVRDCSKMLNRVITDYGICYSFNMQGFNTIFNHEIIDDDFQSYRRTKISKSLIDEGLYNEVMDDDNEDIQWTLEKGYFGENPYFPYRAHKNYSVGFTMGILLQNALNYCNHPMSFIIIHKPNEIPTKINDYYLFKYNEKLFRNIIIKSTRTSEELRRYSPHLRSCYFEGERKLNFFKVYTKVHCEFECQTNYTLKKCGCVKFSMPRNKTTRVCGIKEGPCYWLYQAEYTENSMIPCDCYPPCNDITYSAKEPFYSSPFFQTAERKNYWMEASFEFGTRHNTIVEETESLSSYKLQNLIADIGGLLGFFIGCSVLSIIEICYAVVNFFKDRSRSQNSSNTDELRQVKIINEKLLKLTVEQLRTNMEQSRCNNEQNKKIESLEMRLEEIEKSFVIVEDFEYQEGEHVVRGFSSILRESI